MTSYTWEHDTTTCHHSKVQSSLPHARKLPAFIQVPDQADSMSSCLVHNDVGSRIPVLSMSDDLESNRATLIYISTYFRGEKRKGVDTVLLRKRHFPCTYFSVFKGMVVLYINIKQK